MLFSELIYFNFFSTGALIATSFTVIVGIFLFLTPRKTTATLHLALVYGFISIQNFAYIIASAWYSPEAAFHRWLTVFAVLPSLIHIGQFFFHFPEKKAPKTSIIFLAVQYITAFFVMGVFVIRTLRAPRIFHFEGHYWDFDADLLSFYIAIIIMIYILIVIGIAIWRITTEHKGRRAGITGLLISFMIVAILPGIANTLSREGAMDRGTFQTIWNIVTITGWFTVFILYINIARERITLLTKIVSISLVSFLLVLQIISYYILEDLEDAFDSIHHTSMLLSIHSDIRPPNMTYLVSYPADTDIPDMLYTSQHTLPCMRNTLIELRNTQIHSKFIHYTIPLSAPEIQKILKNTHPGFGGYRSTIETYIEGRDTSQFKGEKIAALLTTVSGYTDYYRRKISILPSENFPVLLRKRLKKVNPVFRPFRNFLLAQANTSPRTGQSLKREILRYMVPVLPESKRRYRSFPLSETHGVAFIHIENDRIYEAGFSYLSYRQYINPTAMKLIMMLGSILVVVLVGFRIFFLGAFISPLKRLLQGVSQVNTGNLEAIVSVRQEDELGHLSHAFNNMVYSVRKTNDEINHIRLYLKNIFDSMPSILIGIDNSGSVTHWNRQAEISTKIDGITATGAQIEKLLPYLTRYSDIIHAAIDNKKIQHIEKVPYFSGNTSQCLDIIVYPLISNGVDGAVIRIDDITERVRFEEIMIQSEKMASVGGLAAGMAHEINNPLGGILLAAQNIERRFSPDLRKNITAAQTAGIQMEQLQQYMELREIHKMLHDILEMGDRASRIVTNMLNFSRRSESKKAPQDLREIIDTTIELAANDYDLKKKYDFRHIEIIREYEDDIPMVHCVQTEIQQVILNLLKNATHAMREKRYYNESPRITLRIYKINTMVQIEVEDNGPGIDETTRKRIFEPFFTTKSVGSGTGLGLAVSYFIIHNDHKGSMTVDSIAGKYTKFTIKLPLS